MVAAVSLSAEISTPHTERGSRVMGSGIADGIRSEHQRRRAPQQRAEAERDHDQRDQRPPDQSAEHHPVEGERDHDHAGACEADGSGHAESQRVEAGRGQPRAHHRPLAQREVDHARGLVDDDERERDQGVDGAGQRAVHDQGGEEQHSRLKWEGASTAPSQTLPQDGLRGHSPRSKRHRKAPVIDQGTPRSIRPAGGDSTRRGRG